MKRIIPSYKNLVDILQDAIDQEHDASQFYAEAAELAQEPEVKEFLMELAKMEEDHHRLLKEKLESLKADQRIMDGILSSYGESEEETSVH